MKRLLLIGAIITLLSGVGFAAKFKVLVVPPANKVNSKTYGDSKFVQTILYKSVYNVIAFIPSVDTPTVDDVYSLNVNPGNIKDVCSKYRVDYVVFGSYTFSGDSSSPDAKIKWYIWNNPQNKNILKKDYKTATDFELFDTVDEIVPRTVEAILGKKVDFATLNFNKFNVGSEHYVLRINKKIVDTITNSSFSLSMKIIAGENYNIEVLKKSDGISVYNIALNLKKDESTNITYSAMGTITIGNVRYKDKKKKYLVYLDGNTVKEGEVLKNVPAGEHTIIVKEDGGEEIYRETFKLEENTTKEIHTSAKWGGMIHGRIYTLDHCWLGIEGNLFLSRYLWVGVGTGFSFGYDDATSQVITADLYFTPFIDVGYFLLGDMNYDLRVAVGGGVKMDIATSTNENVSAASDELISIKLGVFGLAEYKFISLKMGFYFPLNTTMSAEDSFGFSLGWKF